MPRRPKPKWPALPKRPYNGGSLSRDPLTGIIRARLPKRISPTRRSQEFAPDQGAAASAWLDAEIASVGEVVVAALTLRQWAGKWWSVYVEPIHPPNTARWYLYALRKLEEHYELLMPDVRTSHLQAVVGQLNKTVDPATIKGIVSVWRRCFEAAVDDEIVLRNVAKRVTAPKSAKKATGERRYATPAEVAKLWPRIRGERFEAAYALMLGCGLRIGEILGLHWEHVDFANKRAWVQHQFTNGHWRPLPKGSNPHWVPLPSGVLDALKRHRLQQPAGCTLVMQSLFDRPQKRRRFEGPRPWSRTIVVADLAKLLAELKIDHMTPHAGRHGLASYWLDRGIAPSVVAERLGHSNAGVTLAFYAHGSEEGMKRASDLVDDLLTGSDSDDVPPSLLGKNA